MLYFKALFDGIDAMPEADAAVRAAARRAGRERRLAGAACRAGDGRPDHRGAPGAERRAAHPARARGPPLSGRPLSAWHTAKPRRRAAAADLARAERPRLAARAHRASASTRCSTPASSTRCGRCARAATCIPDLPSMRCVGYRQAWAALDGRRSRGAAREPASPPPASSPSASSPGCAPCRSGGSSPATRPMRSPGCVARSPTSWSRPEAAAPMAVLEIASLAKRYGETVGVRARRPRGRAPASSSPSLGESGVGKSTLLNCIAGLDRVDAGTVRIGRVDVAGAAPSRRRRALRRDHLGFVFQAFHVLPHLTVAANVGAAAAAAGPRRRRRGSQAMLARGRPRRLRRRACRRRSRAASCSAWRSRARWCTARS